MKRFAKWLGKIVARVLVLVLTIVLLPYASKYINRWMPDGTQSAVTLSAILERHMESSQRLETAVVEDTGVLTSTVDAKFIGAVQKVTFYYTYRASLGIDLTKIEISQTGSRLEISIPEIEVLQDSLEPTSVEKDDFWFPLTEKRRMQLLEDEKLKCRTHYLEENAENQQAKEYAAESLKSFISQFIGTSFQEVEITYLEETAEES
ncbi:MAG: DUF4230 domain-containing protein [Clostridia bacterium]|nr:DUF4230 domain-containing protein [Clostridia bacterium]